MASQKKGSNSKKNTAKSTSKNTVSRAQKREMEQKKQSIKEAIMCLVFLAIAILLFISNFGVGGAVGSVVSNALFALFGIVSYAFPFALLYICFSIISINRNLSGLAIAKLISGIMLVMMFCMFCYLVYYNGETATPFASMKASYEEHNGGGLFGGCFGFVIIHGFGKIGAYVIDVVILLICLILIAQRSPINGIRAVKEKMAEMRMNRTSKYESEEYEDDYYEDEVLSEVEASGVTRSGKNRLKRRGVGVTNNLEVGESESETINGRKDLHPVFRNADFDDSKYASDIEEPSVESMKKTVLSTDGVLSQSDEMKEIIPQNAVVPPVNITGNNIIFDKNAEVTDSAIDAAMENVIKDAELDAYAFENDYETEQMPVDTRENKPATVAPDSGKHYVPDQNFEHYKLPPTDILEAPKKGSGLKESELKATATKLVETLAMFGVNLVKPVEVSCGPTVTRYEIEPPPGVKVSKILNLQDDIKLNLAAADIRIEAPIPGKAAVGIEVPNQESSVVSFRELLESKEYKESKSKITFAVGKDIGGNIIVNNIAKMPHLLIAGATGSGKSVCSNSLIMSILFKAKPDEVKFIMIDPKVVELSVYNGIPHLLMPVVTDPKLAAGALQAAVSEMTRRYELFAEEKVRDLVSYNESVKKKGLKPLPQIVIIVDELADLMMAASNDVEEAICRLAQLARAAGMHLVIATQRPSVNVITGLIKANMPSRIALSVTSNVDSRTIIDMAGAEKLLGHGDMLFFPQGLPKPIRVQGAWVSDDDIANVIDFIKSQATYVEDETFVKNMEQAASNANTVTITDDSLSSDEGDPLALEAAKIIVDKEKASIGMLQRYLKVGFNRAARIMDELEEMGIVGPEMGTKPRTVLMSQEQFDIWLDENQ